MKVKFCPKCGNIEIEDVTHAALYADARTLKCVKCGFTNKLFPEADAKEIDKIKKKLNSKQRQK